MHPSHTSKDRAVMLLNASKSSMGDIIKEQDNECDHDLLPKSRRRRKSMSVEKLKSSQSGAI